MEVLTIAAMRKMIAGMMMMMTKAIAATITPTKPPTPLNIANMEVLLSTNM